MSENNSFGDFFRKQRKKLGLGLREFCRKYDFDSGYISKMERGLVKPPVNKKILDSYTKALVLEEDTSEWNQFYDLVAVATDRLPSDLKRKSGSPDEFPHILQKIRELRRRTWTKAVDIERWADTLDARSKLPQLVRQLIHATVDNLEYINIPAHEGIGRRGYDGIVKAEKGNAFVPTGQSVWEMGVSNDPRKKANEDFDNRTSNPGELETKETIFIFVTPRKWEGKSDWCEEKNKLGVWKEVRVYDSDNLEQWLEVAPSVDAWFGCPPGVSDLAEHWENMKILTGKNLKPELFLINRENQIASFVSWIDEPQSSIIFEAASFDELPDFVAAYIVSLDQSKRDEIRSDRILIVDNKESWESLLESEYPLVLIPKPELAIERDLIAKALKHGHKIIQWQELTNDPSRKNNRLSRVHTFEIEQLLESSGVKRVIAKQLAEDSGGSLTVLKRLLANDSKINPPDWARKDNAISLAPLILVGGWDESKEADKEIIIKLLGVKYVEIEHLLNRWSAGKDPLFYRANTILSLISRFDSWDLLSPMLTKSQLKLFEDLILEVLSEDDPMYDLPPEKRYMASIYGKEKKFSDKLKKGFSDTLVLLGAKSRHLDPILNADGIARHVIEKLLIKNSSWQRWASLSPVLPTLAEASPEAFLDAVERDLNKINPELIKLFVTEGDQLFTSSPHPGLLWALETLAWDRKYLRTVSFVLARLTIMAPEINMANTPLNSLRAIYLPWFPQTAVRVNDRIDILKAISEKFKDVAWELLFYMLPEFRGYTMNNPRPFWRDWALNWIPGSTRGDRFKQEDACADMLFDLAGDSIDKWHEIIEKLESFDPTSLDRIIENLKRLNTDDLDTKDRMKIYEALRVKVSDHKRFSDAVWALPSDIISNLDELMNRFGPVDLVDRYKWLFVSYPELPDQSRDISYAERNSLVLEKRKQVVQEIFHKEGLSGVMRLSNEVESPGGVGYALAYTELIEKDKDIIPSLLDSDNEKLTNFASGFVSARFEVLKWDWVKTFNLKNWTTEEVGNFALALPVEMKTWQLIEQQDKDVSRFYWRTLPNIFIEPHKESIEYAARKFLESGRPYSTISLLSHALYGKCNLDLTLVFDTLEAGLNLDQINEPVLGGSGHDIVQLFEYLQKNTDNYKSQDLINYIERLARLEWNYLDILSGVLGKPKTLENAIATSPEFFAELIAIMYRSKKDPQTNEKPPTEEQKAKASSAFKLFWTWKTIPGSLENGTVDKEALMDWIKKARKRCDETGHLSICDDHIGQVLAHDPEKELGSWPCIPVRHVIEEVSSDELESGFVAGIFNKRGTVTKGVFEGGQQERELASKYYEYARGCDIDWPRTAAALRRVAKYYEEDARREDEEVKGRL